ncbi:MAG: hypothetical protein J07HX64_01485 [halophilic archaeon J07HX64]|jgi:hypothetical protein|nr:MAG: hypothetical protein J07HX64_01485 [halophilic archaeon J07HX64]
MTDEPAPPGVPNEHLDSGWEFVEERTETVAELSALRVRSVTRRYDDERSRAALSEAGYEIDHPVRFFAVSRLEFEPSLPPGVGTTMVAPKVRTEARKAFVNRLTERGLKDVTRDRTERVRLPDDSRMRLFRHTGTVPPTELDAPLPLECWVGVWPTGGTFLVVAGAHPTVTLDSRLDTGTAPDSLHRSPDEYWREFLELLRETGERN